ADTNGSDRAVNRRKGPTIAVQAPVPECVRVPARETPLQLEDQPMPNGNVDKNVQTARRQLVQRSSEVDLLTAQIYANPLAMDNSTLWEMLSRAEAARQQALSELQRAEAQRKNQGILFTTLSDSLGPRVMGRDTTGLAVTAKLRMERVPTGIVH